METTDDQLPQDYLQDGTAGKFDVGISRIGPSDSSHVGLIVHSTHIKLGYGSVKELIG